MLESGVDKLAERKADMPVMTIKLEEGNFQDARGLDGPRFKELVSIISSVVMQELTPYGIKTGVSVIPEFFPSEASGTYFCEITVMGTTQSKIPADEDEMLVLATSIKVAVAAKLREVLRFRNERKDLVGVEILRVPGVFSG